ncbi:hypothetical protein FKM82_007741 [Ascaphus truei]
MEDSDPTGMAGEQGVNLDSGSKLSEFTSRPPGYPSQPGESRSLQQIPQQLMQQQGQAGQGQQQQQQQQMMMMLMMQQDQKPVRLPMQQGVFNPRAALNADAQRMPMQQGGNMPVMVSMQGSGSIPPSPDKQRMPMSANPSLGNNGRKMGFQDNGQNPSGSPLGEGSSGPPLPDATDASGLQSSMAPHMLISQNQMMMAGTKPGPPSLSLAQGASPQQQHANAMSGNHGHHFQSVQAPSQTSRPKTPNRASPRPYYPQTPNNRPPSTEPSEISLSPERLNASIAGLFPPQINIPLPPRPNLNRGFDQQGLNPTTLKAIGQAPPGLAVNNPSGFVPSHMNKLDNGGSKQPNAGGNKRASPSNSRRSSPASSRKATPSPGRQNAKAAKLALGSPPTPGVLQSMEMQRNNFMGPASLQTIASGPMIGQYPPISTPVTSAVPEESKDSPTVLADTESQLAQVGAKDQVTAEPKTVAYQEMKMVPPEEPAKNDAHCVDASKLPAAEESKSGMSQAMREVPTSLSQLLDHSGAPNVTIKSLGPLPESPPMQFSTEDLKQTEAPAPQGEELSREVNSTPKPPPNTELCTTQVGPDPVEPKADVSLSLPAATLKRPVGATSISSPLPQNQITVFVTSNPITTSANMAAPLTPHLQPTLVSTVVTMPNVGSKVIVSEGQQGVQSSARPQFIAPVFINSSSIIQVMKGSQQGNIPASTMASNTNLMPQSVAVMGSLHISPNIQFSSGPPSTTTPSSNVSGIPTTRPVLNSVQTPSHPTPCPSPSTLPPPPAPPQLKDCKVDDAGAHAGTSADQCPPGASQPVVSPPLEGSPGPSAGSKRSTAASAKGQGKVDKIGQLLLTKAGKKVTNSPEGAGEGQLPAAAESSDAAAPVGTEAPKANGAGRTPSPPKQTTSEASSTATVSSSAPTCPRSSTPVNVQLTPAAPALQDTAPGSKSSQGGVLAEPIGTGLADGPAEQPLDTVCSQSSTQPEASVSAKEAVPERAEPPLIPNAPESTEERAHERSRPPTAGIPRWKTPRAPGLWLESGQR